MQPYYILEGKTPINCSIEKWTDWYKKGDKRVGLNKNKDVEVSTVFLGIDHAWNGGPPLLFETMIFGGIHDQEQWRYSTWGEAESGHKVACDLAL